MTRSLNGIKRGRLSSDEIEQIDALAERGLTPGRIAMKLNRHPGTVNYAMHRLGHRKLVRRSTPYLRNGVLVKPFSAEEDAFIQALRVQKFSTPKIADLITKRFGHTRTAHTVQVRLVMLASAETAAS